jgi:general secretion pathway protein K
MHDLRAKARQPRNAHERVASNPEFRILNPAFPQPAGVALLAVMATVSVLLLVAMAFSGSVQIETRSTIYRKEATQAYALALGGVQAAILEIAYPLPEDQKDKPRLWRRGQSLLRVPYAGGVALVEIVNETGKVDLNVADRKQLVRLFLARGLDKDRAISLAKAIDHWRSPAGSDEADFKALDQYYLEAGYHPAHDSFTSVEEVLRVCGMSRDIFYGTAEYSRKNGIHEQYGVGKDLTVYSKSTAVNVNYASESVLLSVPGVTEEFAESLVQERRNKPFDSAEDISRRLGASEPDSAVPFLSFNDDSKIYTVTSVGMVKGSRLQRTVKAVVSLEPDGTASHRILGWYDEVTE